MATLRIRQGVRNIKKDKVDRAKTRDVVYLSKKRLNYLKILSVITTISLILNIYLLKH